MTTKSLQALLSAKCASSGLTPAHARKLHLTAAPAAGAALTTIRARGAMQIPYFHLNGSLAPATSTRWRYLEPPIGWAALLDDPGRYVSARGAVPWAYVPPLLARPWAAVAADPTVAVLITEGELKAACACAHGLPAIGLGGVDMLGSKRRGLDMVQPLDEFNWTQRAVTIVFDSDLAVKPAVAAACERLAHALTRAGALPRVAALAPPAAAAASESAQKLGLDDFIVRYGVEALKPILDAAQPWAEAQALWALNRDYLCVDELARVFARKSGRLYTAHDFTSLVAAHKTCQTTAPTGALRQAPAGPRWLAWPARATVARLTYVPGAPRLVAEQSPTAPPDAPAELCWNKWSGLGVQPTAGDIAPWRELMDHIFADAPAERRYFEQWCAYPLQNMGTVDSKMFVAVLFWGCKQGTGKSFPGQLLRNVYGRNNASLISNVQLTRNFNKWSADKQFVMGEEIIGDDRRETSSILKNLITQEEAQINDKYVPEYQARDWANYYFSSNEPDALYLDDGDRRFFVHEVKGTKPLEFFRQRLQPWRDTCGPAVLLHHLLHVDLTGFDPRAPALMTDSKRNMIRNNKSALADWITTLREDRVACLRVALPRATAQCELYALGQLLPALHAVSHTSDRVTLPGLARELKRAGFAQAARGMPVPTAVGPHRLWALANVERWMRASPTECTAHWNSFFSGNSNVKGDKF